jgi:ABC-type proline/glycine betaine transport system permease subunit
MGMARVTASFTFGVVLMGLGVAYFVIGLVNDMLGLVIYSMLPFIIGIMIVMSEVATNRHREDKDRGW